MWRILALIVALVSTSPTALAQEFEVGANVGGACVGSEGSGCGGGAGFASGVYGSLWTGERIEVGARFARHGREAGGFSVPRDGRFSLFPGAPDRVDVSIDNRSRSFLAWHGVYHFARGRAVRPFLGLAVGTMTDRRRVQCEPAGCEPLLPMLVGPSEARWHPDVAIVAGLGGRVRSRLAIRAEVRLHNIGAEDLSGEEWFFGAGWVFRR